MTRDPVEIATRERRQRSGLRPVECRSCGATFTNTPDDRVCPECESRSKFVIADGGTHGNESLPIETETHHDRHGIISESSFDGIVEVVAFARADASRAQIRAALGRLEEELVGEPGVQLGLGLLALVIVAALAMYTVGLGLIGGVLGAYVKREVDL